MIGVHAENLHLLASSFDVGLRLFGIGLRLLVFALGDCVMIKEILRSREFLLLQLVIGKRLLIVGESAGEVTTFKRGKNLALVHVVPRTDSHLDDSPTAEVETCIAKLLALAQADKGPVPLDLVTDYQLVWALYNKKLQPRLQLELAQKSLDQLALESKQPSDDRTSSKTDNEDRAFWVPYNKFSGYFWEADAYVRLQQADKAQDALRHADAALQALKSQINGKDDFRKAYARQESSYWLAEARLAELQGQKLDAMAYYESALLARLDSGSLPVPGEKDDLAHDAHQLWASLGGSDESWKLWYTRRADAIAAQSHLTWENTTDPLPAFQLADLQGKTWQLADLKGKVVFLNFWASY